MVELTKQNRATVQNLRDAGCTEEFIDKFMLFFAEGKTGDQLRELQKHRRLLLDNVHTAQKKIDCLDYLIYTIEKQKCKERTP